MQHFGKMHVKFKMKMKTLFSFYAFLNDFQAFSKTSYCNWMYFPYRNKCFLPVKWDFLFNLSIILPKNPVFWISDIFRYCTFSRETAHLLRLDIASSRQIYRLFEKAVKMCVWVSIFFFGIFWRIDAFTDIKCVNYAHF